jgi:hypothetical protein
MTLVYNKSNRVHWEAKPHFWLSFLFFGYLISHYMQNCHVLRKVKYDWMNT